MPMYVPEFKNVVMPAVTAAMDEWRTEAQKGGSLRHWSISIDTTGTHAEVCIAEPVSSWVQSAEHQDGIMGIHS